MTHTLFDELSVGQIYYEESEIDVVTQEGLRLVQSLRDGEVAESDRRQKVREYLERQAEVIGSGATRPVIREYYSQLDQLSVEEVAKRLEQMVNAMHRLFLAVQARATLAGRTFDS